MTPAEKKHDLLRELKYFKSRFKQAVNGLSEKVKDLEAVNGAPNKETDIVYQWSLEEIGETGVSLAQHWRGAALELRSDGQSNWQIRLALKSSIKADIIGSAVNHHLADIGKGSVYADLYGYALDRVDFGYLADDIIEDISS